MRYAPVGRGKPDGAYPSIHPVDLHAYALRSLIERTGIDPTAVDEAIGGAVGQIGEQSGTPPSGPSLISVKKILTTCC
jgi:acetyl-CoA acyltransferase